MIYNKKYKCYVSRDGLVFGIKNDKLVLRSTKPFPHKKYIRVYVWDYETNKNVSKRLHRLVWETFCGEIPEGMQIDHIDGNPANNKLDNLRLVTPKENSNNPNTIWKLQGENNGMFGCHHSTETRKRISECRKGIRTPHSKSRWSKYGLSRTEIEEKLNLSRNQVEKLDKEHKLMEVLKCHF